MKRAKPKFRVGQKVLLTDFNETVELTGRHELPGIWEWRIKGVSAGTAPEHLLRKIGPHPKRGGKKC